jgi:hypothetical protein
MPSVKAIAELVDLAQKVIGVLGPVITTLGILWPKVRIALERQRNSVRDSLPPASMVEHAAPADAELPGPLLKRLAARTGERGALIEFAFAMLLGAAFSAILADALFKYSPDSEDALKGFLAIGGLCGALAILLSFAWLQRQLEFAIGTLSTTVMLVLLLSTQSSLIVEKPDLDAQVVLLLPLLSLLALAVAAITFLFGNPFAWHQGGKHKGVWVTALLLVLLLAACVLGRQQVRALEADPRTPTSWSTDIEQFLADIFRLSPSAQKDFYQLASEGQLDPQYRNQHALAEAKFRRDRDLLESLSAAAPANDTANRTDSGTTAPPTDDARRVGETVDLHSPSALDDLRKSELHRNLLSTVHDRFRLLPVDARLNYMHTRLTWTHPLGSETGRSRAAYPLPGTSSESRFRECATLRRSHAVTQFGSSDPSSVGNHKATDPTPLPQDSGAEPDSRSNLFTPIPASAEFVDLHTQLTWSVEDEAWEAFEEYKDLAYSKFGANARPLLTQFDALPATTRGALGQLLMDEKRSEQVFQLLAALSSSDVDYGPISDAGSTIDLQLLSTKLLNPGSDVIFGDNRQSGFLQKLTDSSTITADQRRALGELLAQPITSVQSVLGKDALDWVKAAAHEIESKQLKEFFAALAEPVRVGAIILADRKAQRPTENIVGLLQRFAIKTQTARESILLRVARRLYGTGGDSGYLPYEQLIYQGREVSWAIAVFIAGTFAVPFLALAVLLGMFAGRKLTAHHRHRALLDREVQETMARGVVGSEYVLGVRLTLRGRESFLGSLHTLGQRGWTTTAVVGRRGIGKSRALYELTHAPVDVEQAGPRIAAWISAPTEFEEKEFVLTALERLADAVEMNIARYLGAEPLVVRQAEARISAAAVVLFTCALVLEVALALNIQPKVEQSISALYMLPIAAQVAFAVFILVTHLVRMQPINLEPWLERERNQHVATALLYKEARAVRATTESIRATSRWPAIAGAFGLGVVISLAMVVALSGIRLIRSSDDQFTAFFVFAVPIAIWRLATANRDARNAHNRGFMTLVSQYRSFAQTVVRRLRDGALGGCTDGARVVIAIDELDKMPLDDIRTFVRRIKALFEVPGVFYYVSISEDALARLYLGVGVGKDEFDSSFDHVVQLPPLQVEEARISAREFFESIGTVAIDERLADVVAAVSFGIPRDILRRADEAREWRSRSACEFLASIRIRHAELGYRFGIIRRDQRELLNGNARSVEAELYQALEPSTGGDGESGEQTLRFWLLAWVYSALELAAAANTTSAAWLSTAEKLRAVGYRIPTDPPGDVIQDMVAMRDLWQSPWNAKVSSVGTKGARTELDVADRTG